MKERERYDLIQAGSSEVRLDGERMKKKKKEGREEGKEGWKGRGLGGGRGRLEESGSNLYLLLVNHQQ